MMRLFDTATRELQPIPDHRDKAVTIYTCGPTVYDYLTVGNWASYIRWDILVRTLLANGYDVNRVMNITDVGHLVSDADDGEDKLQKGARRENKSAWDVARFYSNDFIKGMESLFLLSPDHLVRATDHIAEQIELIQRLESKRYTYQTSDGIYFDTAKFAEYAKFARLDLDALKAGARVEHNPEKRHPSDFALWKFSPENEQRDMEWQSPWGTGFPGWHIECSAMAMRYLGETIDIHTGGIDHIPVHHTNEIAQSEAATDMQFSRLWVHGNFMTSEGRKISKSLGNGYTLQDLSLKGFETLAYKLLVMQGHYSRETDFTFESLTAATNRLRHWRDVASLRWQTHDTLIDEDEKEADNINLSLLRSINDLRIALADNLDTPRAVKIIDEAFTSIENSNLMVIHQGNLVDLVETIDTLLGLELMRYTPDIDEEMKRLIIERSRQREARDFKKADEIRTLLEQRHEIILKDNQDSVLWRRLHYSG